MVSSARFLRPAFVLALMIAVLGGMLGCEETVPLTLSDVADAELIADAGPDLEVAPGDLVVLEGMGSLSSGEGDFGYLWSQLSGIPVELSDADDPQASFYAPETNREGQELVFRLAVTDGFLGGSDDVVVAVTPVSIGHSDPDNTVRFRLDPAEGRRPLTVTARAVPLAGETLPEGNYTWTFDGVSASGLAETHAVKSHVFATPGLHTVTLTMVVGGMTVGCLDTQTGTVGGRVTVYPIISGHVRNEGGGGMPGVVVAANRGGGTSVTDASGSYAVHVPYGWSGTITPQHVGYSFSPSSLNYWYVRLDISGQDVVGTPSGNEPPAAQIGADPMSGTAPLTVTFQGSGSDPDGVILGYSWNFGDGTAPVTGQTVGGTIPQITHSYENMGTYVVTLTVADNGGEIGQASTDPIVVGNTPPVIGQGESIVLSVEQDSATSDPDNRLLLDATDPDAEPGTLVWSISAAPSNGVAAIESGSPSSSGGAVSVSYQPQSGYVGGDTFAVQVNDGQSGGTDTITVSVTVNAVPNGAPTADDQQVRVAVNGSKHIVLTARDRTGWSSMQPLADPLSFEVLTQPAHGTVYGAPPKLLYLPDQDYQGPDTIVFRVNDGTADSDPGTIHITVTPWTTPIGIPDPGFGLNEVAGAPTYYIDNTHPDATDTDNPFGTSARPRRTIPDPLNLVPGDVVEIAGGDYSGHLNLAGGGAPGNPAFLRGSSVISRPSLGNGKIWFTDAQDGYIIVENLTFRSSARIKLMGSAHHIALRHCENMESPARKPAVVISGGDDGNVHHIVVYNCLIHDNGNWLINEDEDSMGIRVGRNTSYVWILDSEFYHNSGSGVQINAGQDDQQLWRPTLHHVYLGRSAGHHNKQSAFWTKAAEHVVFSQNKCYSNRPVGEEGAGRSSPGEGIGGQYGPNYVWVLFNEIWDSDNGVRFSTDNGPGGPPAADDDMHFYVIGNVIHNIHHSTIDVTGQYPVSWDPNNAWAPGKAIAVWHQSATKHIIHNTVYDAEWGITVVRPTDDRGPVVMANNILAGIVGGGGGDIPREVHIEHSQAAGVSQLHHTLFDGSAGIEWGTSTIYDLGEFRNVFPGQGNGCLEADVTDPQQPFFVNPDEGDFHLPANSPAVDAGLAYEAYQTFLDLYGIDITVDFDGNPRPRGNGWDMGAYENQGN